MAEEGARKGGAMQRVVLWLVILALFGVVLWLASERNGRRCRVAGGGGEPQVERGLFFPTGSAPANDKIYGSIATPAGEHPPAEMEFDDQNSLDRWLFDVLTAWAKASAKKGDT